MNTSSFLICATFGFFLLIGCTSGSFLFTGVNEAGAEFGDNIPGVSGTDYTFPTTGSIDYMVSSGMNVIRMPFLWERLQPSISSTTFDSAYLASIDKMVTYVTVTKGIYILLDVHNYARYNNAVLGQGVSYSAFQALWTNLATKYKSNPKVIFGLMNEPNTMPYDNVYQAMQAGINGIRSTGATNLILVPGNDWTGAHSWLDGSAASMIKITDPLNNFMFEMHQYFDSDFSGTTSCVSTFDPATIFGPATNWLRTNGKTAFLGEFGIESTTQCLAVLQKTMTYLSQNDDVWKGWTWWAAGPWWGNYFYSLEKGAGDKQMAILKQFIPSSYASLPSSSSSYSTSSPAVTPVPVPVPVGTSTTGKSSTSTTGKSSTSTTGKSSTSTTGKSSTSTTGKSSTSTTTGASTTTTGKTASSTSTSTTGSSSSSSDSCTFGQIRCSGTSQYQQCASNGIWNSPQSCETGLMCSTIANTVYCLMEIPSLASSSTSTSGKSSNSASSSSTSTTAAAPSTPSTPSTSDSDSDAPCTAGNQRCVGTSQYQTCANGRSGTVWAATQSCQSGLSCHASATANNIYCY